MGTETFNFSDDCYAYNVGRENPRIATSFGLERPMTQGRRACSMIGQPWHAYHHSRESKRRRVEWLRDREREPPLTAIVQAPPHTETESEPEHAYAGDARPGR